MAHDDFKLPLGVVGKSELRRLAMELDRLDDYFVKAAAQKNDNQAAPPVTHLLDEISKLNSVNLLEAGQRKKLGEALNEIIKQAPALSISFASEPSPQAVQRLLAWFRDNIHPQALLQIGLQPAIAAGCILRTPNKIFDLSISASLSRDITYLTRLINGAASGGK